MSKHPLAGPFLALVFSHQAALQGQIVNGSFDIDPWPIYQPTGWTGGTILGGQVGGPLFWVPTDRWPFDMIQVPSPPIGVDGCCSAGVGSQSTLKQLVSGGAGRGYLLSFQAQSMGGLAAAAQLQVRVLGPGDVVIAESTPILGSGGAGSAGFRKFELWIPPLTAGGPLTIEFANLESKESEAAVDGVTLVVLGAPVLDPPRLVGGVWKLAWSETIPFHLPQWAPDISGPWTDVSLDGLRTEGGKHHLDIPFQPDAGSGFYRTRSTQP